MTIRPSNPILDAALAYAAAGIPVFPCDPRPDPPGTPAAQKRAKRPLVPGADKDAEGRDIPKTGGLHRATTDPETIRAWWRNRPQALIGMPTGGRSGILAIDFDPHGETVAETEARLIAAVGPLPVCPRVRTQSGGMHLYFRMPDGIEAPRNSAKRLQNIDWRGDGGYVIVPPSTMLDGNGYSWVVEWGAVDLPDPPPALLDLVLQRGAFARERRARPNHPEFPDGSVSSPAQSSVRRPVGDDPGARQVRLYGLATLDRARGDVAGCAQGRRGHELNAAAYGMAPLVSLGILSEREVHDALIEAAEACGLVATDGAAECAAKIRRGLAAGAGNTAALSAKVDSIRREAAERQARGGRRPEPPPIDTVPDWVRGDGAGGGEAEDGPGEAAMLAGLEDDAEAADGDMAGDMAGDADGDAGGGADGAGARPASRRRRSGARGDGDDGEPPRPKAMGYSVDWMNERYALVMMGSKAVIMHENPDAPLEDRHGMRSLEAFGAWFSNRFTEVVDRRNGGTKAVTWASRWMTDRKRRQYGGIVFHPAPDEASPAPEGYFNLWRGFAFRPVAKPGGYSIFEEHLRNHICAGRQDYFRYVFGWIAHIIQRPRERIGIAMVLRGKMGTGKSKIGEVIGALIPAHYFLVDDPRYVTGNFNSHMASCILLQADEAVWAGDKTAEGRLKGLITATRQMIEAKGVDPVRVDNYVRLLMTSNEGWVVPAGKDERRYAVFDVSDAVAQNHAYFAEMDDQLRDGGFEALLHDLMAFDLSSVNLRTIPRTDALLEQKIRSLDSVDSWWFERLRDGRTTRKSGGWLRDIERSALFEDYLGEAERVGWKRRASDTEVGQALARLCPAIRTYRPRRAREDGSMDRPRVYHLPELSHCRGAFELAVGQSVDWQDEVEDAGPGGGDDDAF